MRNRYKPTVHGVGFLGEGKYNSKSKAYTYWANMLKRYYCKASLLKNPTYSDVTVCEEWHNLQNFGEWFDKNYIEGYQLDKDMKVTGSKVYSPTTCTFIPHYKNAEIASAKYYKFINPEGELISIYNLRAFCKENPPLLHRRLSDVHNGVRKSHRGWTKA